MVRMKLSLNLNPMLLDADSAGYLPCATYMQRKYNLWI